jgi:hypothetical protein
MRTTIFHVRGGLALGLAGLLGCGLISSDIGTLTFQLPAQTFSFDASDPMWKAPPGNFPAVSCGAGGQVTDCCQSPAGAPAVDCTATPLVCDNGFCALQYTVSIPQTIDLKSQVPALSSLGGQTLAEITISQIHYHVNNLLNVALPPITIYLGAANVTSASDPNAVQKFGTLPSVPAMSTADGDVMLDPAGQAAFAKYAQQFTTPFNFIATSTVLVPAGTPTPAGSAVITVTAQVSAKPSL